MALLYNEIIEQLLNGNHLEKEDLIKGKSLIKALEKDINKRLGVEE